MSAPVVEQFPIRTVAALTGVNAITLRAWERRYGLISPLRTPTGHRLYTHHHVEQIRRVLALADRGVPISRVRDLLDADTHGAGASRGRGPWRDYQQRMLGAIARFDEPELDRIYDEALSVHAIEHVTRQLILPLLTELGRRWMDLPGAIAEEHFFAVYMRSKLGTRLQHRMRYTTGPMIVAACAPGEQHEIGLLLFALEAHDAGMRTILLGADTPLDDLALAQQRSRSAAVVLSLSLEPPPEFLPRTLPRLVRQTGVPVFVGGTAAIRNRAGVTAAGATALGVDIDAGVRLMAATLSRDRPRE